MKTKALKIKQNTLFVYKSVKSVNNKITTENTDTTGTITTTSGTTGFNK